VQFLVCSLWGKVVILEIEFDEIELVCLIPDDASLQRMFVVLSSQQLGV
jgi:hypothetical protein